MHCVVSIHQVIRIRNIVFATDTHHPQRRQWWRKPPAHHSVHLELERWMRWICNPLCELRRTFSHSHPSLVLHISSSYVFIYASGNVSLSHNECSHHELRKFWIIQNVFAICWILRHCDIFTFSALALAVCLTFFNSNCNALQFKASPSDPFGTHGTLFSSLYRRRWMDGTVAQWIVVNQMPRRRHWILSVWRSCLVYVCITASSMFVRYLSQHAVAAGAHLASSQLKWTE